MTTVLIYLDLMIHNPPWNKPKILTNGEQTFTIVSTNSLVNFSCGSLPCQSFPLSSSSQSPLTEIQTNKSGERDSTLTLASYVLPSNSRLGCISASRSTNSCKKQIGHTVGSQKEWGQIEASNGCIPVFSSVLWKFPVFTFIRQDILLARGCHGHCRAAPDSTWRWHSCARLDDPQCHICIHCFLSFLSFVIFSASGSLTHLDHCFHTVGLHTRGCCLIGIQKDGQGGKQMAEISPIS